MSHRTLTSIALLGLLVSGCSNRLDGADRGPNDPDLTDDTDGSNDTDDTDVPEDCDDIPGAGTVPTDEACSYVPEPSGAPLAFRVEWSMAQAMTDLSSGRDIPAWSYSTYPALRSVMQVPVVGQTTDDNGDGRIDELDTPDIAAVMGSGFDDAGDTDAVLRLLSGDGARVHASTFAQSFTNARGTYTYSPFKHSGVAIGNLDGGSDIELVVMVMETGGDLACRPAIYKVEQSGSTVDLVLDRVYAGSAYYCGAHAPALADIDDDGEIEVILGNTVLNSKLEPRWSGPSATQGGRGWYGRPSVGWEGYWNSGYHSFPYDLDGDGRTMEIVAGRTAYTHRGDTYCELGRYDGSTWIPATDGYPAVADLRRFTGDTEGEPEIVITGNERVSVYHGDVRYDPYGLPRCVEIDSLPNDPWLDNTTPSGFAHAECNRDRRSFGGQPTIADMSGDGRNEIGVAGACWYSVYRFDELGSLVRYAMAPTRDWSSASTGSTVFDFNGDGRSQVVFADERALYVWSVNPASGLRPWERLNEILVDENHKSWTVHEYPVVADVDGDGKAEIVVPNAYIPSWPDYYGLYVIGAADDDWVSARQLWNQHAYHVTNVSDSGEIGYAAPNYAPYDSRDLNDFRNQAPGSFGALAAPDLTVTAEPPCQEDCGDAQIIVQVGNGGGFISVGPAVEVSLYGVRGTARTFIEAQELGITVAPGQQTPGIVFDVAGWSRYDHLIAVVDDPLRTDSGWGAAKECDEDNNEVEISLDGLCE